MSFISDLFGKGKKGKLNIPITKLPSSPAEEKGTEVRLPSGDVAGPEIKDEKSWEAKKIPVWKPGDVILDHYEIEDVITSGGMGRIYIANHRNWKVKVAIKSPTEEMLKEKDLFSRVEKEAEAWTELGLHPNIAYCYFVRNIEDVPHIFVEYVDGGNLRQWIEAGRCADLKTGLDLAIQFCHGMAYAHSKGMIHRDIKPANILMAKDGILKITDFGIAKWVKVDEVGELHERSGDDLAGKTEPYASPEQFTDEINVGFETDIFSFGLCLWEMLCGRKPYQIAVVKEKIPDPRKLRPDLPEKLYILLEQLVAFEREKREELGGFETLRERFKAIYQELFNEPSPHSELEKVDLRAGGLNNRAISYMELGKEEEAEKCWQEALATDPQHLESTFNYGYYRWYQGKPYRDVLEVPMANLKSSHDHNPDYWRLRAWLHYERGEIDAVETVQNSPYKVTEPEFLKVLEDPDRAVGRLLQVFKGHTGTVNTVAFSPDGSHVLSGSDDKTLRLWDIATGQEIRRFEGCGPATINRELGCLRHMFNMALKWKKAQVNPVREVKFLKEPKEKDRILTEEEEVKLLEAVRTGHKSKHLEGIILTALNTGMRKGEILSLKWPNVDFKNGVITVEKTKNDDIRKIPMNQKLTEILEGVKKVSKSDYVFSENGKPYLDVKTGWWTVLEKAGIENFTFHGLRHTFGSRLGMAGVDIKTIAELMGHKDIKMTMRYSHPTPEHKRKAVETLEKVTSIFTTQANPEENRKVVSLRNY
jgi:serine/threonine protein kinase